MHTKHEEQSRFNKLRNKNLFSGCIHQDENCDKEISKAHSIQNNGILNKLSRNGKVLAVDFSKIYGDNGSFKLYEVGRGKASTFTGFCNNHDSHIFRPIENFEYKMNIQQNFLFAYRSFALGYYERYSSYQLIKARIEDDPKIIYTQLGERYRLYNDHLKYIEKLKTIMNTNLDNGRFDRITTDLLIWPQEYGIASTSMFFIDKDNDGKTINRADSYISPFYFTLFPQSGMTYVLMSYLSKDKSMYQFIKNQIVSLTTEEQKIAISNLIALYIENVFISPEFWGQLSNQTKDQYYKICNSTMGINKPNRLIAYKNFNLFV